MPLLYYYFLSFLSHVWTPFVILLQSHITSTTLAVWCPRSASSPPASSSPQWRAAPPITSRIISPLPAGQLLFHPIMPLTALRFFRLLMVLSGNQILRYFSLALAIKWSRNVEPSPLLAHSLLHCVPSCCCLLRASPLYCRRRRRFGSPSSDFLPLAARIALCSLPASVLVHPSELCSSPKHLAEPFCRHAEVIVEPYVLAPVWAPPCTELLTQSPPRSPRSPAYCCCVVLHQHMSRLRSQLS
jgi:hypothetical protein